MCIRNAINGSSVDWNSTSNNRYSQFLRKRIRHTLSPWRLSNSSLMYSVDNLSRVAKLTSWSQSPGTKARRRSSITRGKAKIRL